MLSLSTDEVHVWYVVPERASTLELQRYDGLLSLEERERNLRFASVDARNRDLVSRALVRTTLSRYTDIDARTWSFRKGQYGRPELAGPVGHPPLRFSLSHAVGLVALAITREADVGLDVEHRNSRAFDINLARKYFASAEVADLESLPADEQPGAFLEYWTLKEAYLKATGAGLSQALDSFAMRRTRPPTMQFAGPQEGDASEWHFSRAWARTTSQRSRSEAHGVRH